MLRECEDLAPRRPCPHPRIDHRLMSNSTTTRLASIDPLDSLLRAHDFSRPPSQPADPHHERWTAALRYRIPVRLRALLGPIADQRKPAPTIFRSSPPPPPPSPIRSGRTAQYHGPFLKSLAGTVQRKKCRARLRPGRPQRLRFRCAPAAIGEGKVAAIGWRIQRYPHPWAYLENRRLGQGQILADAGRRSWSSAKTATVRLLRTIDAEVVDMISRQGPADLRIRPP